MIIEFVHLKPYHWFTEVMLLLIKWNHMVLKSMRFSIYPRQCLNATDITCIILDSKCLRWKRLYVNVQTILCRMFSFALECFPASDNTQLITVHVRRSRKTQHRVSIDWMQREKAGQEIERNLEFGRELVYISSSVQWNPHATTMCIVKTIATVNILQVSQPFCEKLKTVLW